MGVEGEGAAEYLITNGHRNLVIRLAIGLFTAVLVRFWQRGA